MTKMKKSNAATARKTTQRRSKGNTNFRPQSDDLAKKNPRSRGWLFTSFEDEPPVYDEKLMTYLLYAPEICPHTNKNHWQSFVQWKYQHTLTASAKKLNHAHHDLPMGSMAEIFTYIQGPYEKGDKKKPFNPECKEFGIKPEQGKKCDLHDRVACIKRGELTVDSIAVNEPMVYHQFGRTLEKVEAVARRQTFRTEMTEGIWLWGPTGVGKSYRAYAGFHPDTHYVWSIGVQYQCGYTGQETIIMDDFRGDISYQQMLRIIDWTAQYVEVKCKERVPLMAKRVYITSSKPPEKVYWRQNENPEGISELRRRLVIKHIDKRD